MLWTLVWFLVAALFLFAVWAYLSLRGAETAVYELEAVGEIEPLVRSWGQWLDSGGRIVVRDPSTGSEAEFRKRRFKTRPDILVFRYRNADSNRAYFPGTMARFDNEGVEYEMERTRKRFLPRAVAVPLPVADVFTPTAAARLAAIAFPGADAKLQVFCEGRFRGGADVPTIRLIPPTRSRRIGFAFGTWLGRLVSRFTAT